MSAKRILTGLMALGLALCVLGVVFVGNGVRCHFIPVRDAEIVEMLIQDISMEPEMISETNTQKMLWSI